MNAGIILSYFNQRYYSDMLSTVCEFIPQARRGWLGRWLADWLGGLVGEWLVGWLVDGDAISAATARTRMRAAAPVVEAAFPACALCIRCHVVSRHRVAAARSSPCPPPCR